MKANLRLESASATPGAPARRRAPGARVSAVAAVAGLLALTACTSDPGPKRVAQDIIEAESIANPDLDEDCLIEQLNTFSSDDLKRIGDLVGSDDAADRDEGQAGLDELEAALDSCS